MNLTLEDFIPPEIENPVVCISDDYILSAQISSLFNTKSVYFAVLEPPRSLHKYWRNEFIKLNNVLAKIKPGKVVFVRVNPTMTGLIKDQLRLHDDRYRYVNKRSQINEFAKEYGNTTQGTLECPPNPEKVAHALLEAKRTKRRLLITSESNYAIKSNVKKKHIVVSDSSSDLLPVILANYAFSINADLQFFDSNIPYSPKKIYDVIEDTRRDGTRSLSAKEIAKDIEVNLDAKLNIIRKYEFATFLTDDFPYGYFFPDIPSTHIYNKLLPSHFIADSVAEPLVKMQSSLLVDTGFFKDSETDNISDLLVQRDVYVKELRENQFTNLELENSIQFFPYDFLFICSHGQFPSGTRFKIKFTDKAGCNHTIVIDTLDSFTPTARGTIDNPLISVKTFYEFVELDDQAWYNKKYKKGSSKTVIEDFLALDRKDWNVQEREKIEKMRFCNVIVTQDPLGPYIPMIHSISDPQSAPFVFNNACVSAYTMATNFIFAGACFYVGTIKTVNTVYAVNIALSFFEKSIVNGKSLALSIWEAQNDASINLEDRSYICVGCHFKKFSFLSGQDNRNAVKRRIVSDALMRRRRIQNGNMEKSTRDNHVDAITFLLRENERI